MRYNENRERIRAYTAEHPNATMRDIQVKCGISSLSVVFRHMKRLEKERGACPHCGGTGVARDRGTQ